MIILGVDTETNGLEDTREIVELGLVVMNSVDSTILAMHSDLFKTKSWSKEAEAIHHISRASSNLGADDSFNPWELVSRYNPEVIVAHNAEFDKAKVVKRWPEFGKLPWVCTHRDLPHVKFVPKVSSNKLQHLAVDYDIQVPRKHRAMFDALLCCEIAAKHDLATVLKLAKEVKFCVYSWFEGRPNYSDEKFKTHKDYLKKAGFTWDGDSWIKSNVAESVLKKYVALATATKGWKSRVTSVDKQN